MNKWLWLMLIPSLLFADPSEPLQAPPDSTPPVTTNEVPVEIEVRADAIPPKFAHRNPDPIYVDVEADQLTIHPERTVVTARDLMVEGNAFEQFLDQVESRKDLPYIVLLLRPGSAVFQRRLRQAIRDRGIDVGFEPWDAGREVVISNRSVTSPTPVPVATPKELPGDLQKPVFFECRHQQLFPISLERLKQACDDKTAELRAAAAGDETQFLRSAAMTMLEIDGQRLDFTYALMGKYVLTPVPDAKGYSFEDDLKETDDRWFGSQLAELNPETQFLCFFVRPDSSPLFQQARDLAELKNFIVTYERLDENEPIMLAPGGEKLTY